jgi:hypothetical protein
VQAGTILVRPPQPLPKTAALWQAEREMWSEAELLKEMTEAAGELCKMIEQPEAPPPEAMNAACWRVNKAVRLWLATDPRPAKGPL